MEIAWQELKGEGEARGFHACERTRQRQRTVLKRRGGGKGGHLPLCHAHTPTPIFLSALCIVRWHKQTSLQFTQCLVCL